MSVIKEQKNNVERIAFWGICSVVAVWLGIMCLVEIRRGWPATGEQWVFRLVSWAVHLLLLRMLYRGVRRHYQRS